MEVYIQNDKIYTHPSNSTATYRVGVLFADIGDLEVSEDNKTWKKAEWSHQEWCEFFACYLVAKNKQTSGKLHSIIESFGGTEQEVKARKSVAFQLLGLKSLN